MFGRGQAQGRALVSIVYEHLVFRTVFDCIIPSKSCSCHLTFDRTKQTFKRTLIGTRSHTSIMLIHYPSLYTWGSHHRPLSTLPESLRLAPSHQLPLRLTIPGRTLDLRDP